MNTNIYTPDSFRGPFLNDKHNFCVITTEGHPPVLTLLHNLPTQARSLFLGLWGVPKPTSRILGFINYGLFFQDTP